MSQRSKYAEGGPTMESGTILAILDLADLSHHHLRPTVNIGIKDESILTSTEVKDQMVTQV